VPPSDPALITAWIALQKAQHDSPEYHQLFWAFDRVCDLINDDPDQAWDFILAVLATDRSPEIVGILSAGPLEDLLAYHPYDVIERVEAEARHNPHFASLLGGVWQNKMPDDIWKRVQAVWNRKGWDGIPAE